MLHARHMVLAALGLALFAPPGRSQFFNYGYGGFATPFVATNFGTGGFATPFVATNFGTGAFATPLLGTNFATGLFGTPVVGTTFGVGPFGRTTGFTTAGLGAVPLQSGFYGYGLHRRRTAAVIPSPIFIAGGGAGGGQSPINDPSIKDQFDVLTRRLDKLTADLEKLSADVEKLKKNGSATAPGVTVAPGLRPRELPPEEAARFQRDHENKMLEIKKAYRAYSDAVDAFAKDPENKAKQDDVARARKALTDLGVKP